jgi:glycosyltransferase involved in cell wall biosynthesis
VPSDNSKAFAEGIEALYTNDLRQLGTRAREKVEKTFSWNQIMHSLLGLYQDHLQMSWTNVSPQIYACR